ncbi:MAG: GIY-YIG nuclease family protein [Clostridia bacterium]|nr:GIY-YIG nuclease family protein [Clostridia bacterium]
MYYTYLLRCTDGSLYTGIASDWKRRMKQHFTQDPKCAKYTRSHRPQMLCAVWESTDRATASRLEYHLKRRSKSQKELLAAGADLRQIFPDAEFCSSYRLLSEEERCDE